MNGIEKARDAFAASADDFPASYRDGHSALNEVEAQMARMAEALRHLTAEHGTQCRCPGCEVLREGT